MPGFKEHIPVGDHNDRRCNRHDDRFHTFGFGRHGDFFLHKVDKQVEDHAGQDGTVAHQVDPGDDKSERDPGRFPG